MGKIKILTFFFEVAQIVLLVTRSNAAIKCLLYLVSKNKNDSSDRNCLEQDKTLCPILAVKLDRPDTSSALHYELQPDKELLDMTREPNVNYNKEHPIEYSHCFSFLLYIFTASFLLLLLIIYHFNYVLVSRAYHHVHED